MKRTLALMLAALLCLSALTACGKPAEKPAPGESQSTETGMDTTSSEPEEKLNFNREGYPISDKGMTFKLYGLQWPVHKNYSEMAVFQEYEKKSNIHIEWSMMPNESVQEKKHLVFANRDNLPDGFWGQIYSNDDVLNYASQGMIIPLNDLIDKFGPNIKAAMEEYPALRQVMTAPDGNIYSLAGAVCPDSQPMMIDPKLWINKPWMDKLNLKMPTTVDELYQVLKIMKGKDLNGNGQDDEVMFAIEPGLIISFMTPWGIDAPTIVRDGQVKSAYLEPGFRQGLIWFHKLYAEGILDVETFTQTLAQFLGKGSAPEMRYAFFARNRAEQVTGLDNAAYYEPVPSLEGPAGRNARVDKTGGIVANKFVITSACKDPGALIRWVDYFYTDEGALSASRGPENAGWQKTDRDGFSYEILEYVDAEGKHYIPGGTSPCYVSNKRVIPGRAEKNGMEIGQRCYEPYAIKEYFPRKIFYLPDEIELRAEYAVSLANYIEEATAQFITGVRDINSDKDYGAFISELKNLGIEEMLKTEQAAYNRYVAANKD